MFPPAEEFRFQKYVYSNILSHSCWFSQLFSPTCEHLKGFGCRCTHAEAAHLGVRRLRLCDGAVERGPSGQPLSQTLLHSAQLLRQDLDVVLQPLFLLFLQLDLTVQLLPFGVQVLDA